MRKKTLRLWLLCTALLSQSPAWSVDWNWPMGQLSSLNEKEIDKASASYISGDVDSCILTLNSLKGSTQDDPRARHILIEIYREQKRYGEAKRELHELISVFNRYVSTHRVSPPWMDSVPLKIELGDIDAEEGNFAEAASYYREVTTSQPKNTQARMQLARLYETQGDLDGAKSQYKFLAEMPGLSAQERAFYNDRLAQLEKSAAPSSAVQHSGSNRQNNRQPQVPSNGTSHVSSAGYQDRNPEDAGNYGQQPHNGYGESSRQGTANGYGASSSNPLKQASDYISGKNYEAAISVLKDSALKYPANAQIHYLLGLSYAGKKQYGDARKAYEKALQNTQDTQMQAITRKALGRLPVP